MFLRWRVDGALGLKNERRAVRNRAVFYLPMVLGVLPMVLLCVLAQRWGGDHVGGLRMLGLARVGFGMAKIVFLVLPLERLVAGAVEATPEARGLASAWMGCLGFSFQLYFAQSGAVDVVLGVRRLLGGACVELFGDPFIAGGFTGFWRGWNASLMRVYGVRGHDVAAGRNGAIVHGMLSVCAVLLGVVMWRGASAATGVWLGVQGLLLGLEWWRGGRSWLMPLPLPIRAVVTGAVVIVVNMLLYLPDLETAWGEMGRLFVAPTVTVYSVMLEARVTTPWPKCLLWVAMLLGVTGSAWRWLLAQSRAGTLVMAGLLAVLAGGLVWKDLVVTEAGSAKAYVRHLVQKPLVWGLQEGNAQVFVGREGWLFTQAELDQLTRRRTGEVSFGAALDGIVAQCQAVGAPLLLVVVPDKVGVYPQHVLPAEYRAPVQPPGYGTALERLRAAGVTVLDPTEQLWEMRKKTPVYFKRDSHWTPEAMKAVALAAAKVVRQKWPWVAVDETPLIQATILDRSEAGDLARELDPWAPEELFGEEAAQLVSIQGMEAAGASPVVICGGDLMGVFDDAALSFGDEVGRRQSAGFVTQLAVLLGRPLDARPLIRGVGKRAFAPLTGGLAHKKLVVCVVRSGDL